MCVSLKGMYASTKAFLSRRIKVQSEPTVSVGTSISSPYGFKHETVQIPGLGSQELQMLREQAAASRVGVAEDRALPRPSTKVPIRVGVAEETAEPRPVTPMVVTTTTGGAYEEDMVALSPHNQLGKVAGSVSTNEI